MTRTTRLALALLAAAVMLLPANGDDTGSKAQPPPLTVYCPRRMTVEGPRLTLEQIAVLSSDDADLHARACTVAMGRTPWKDETIAIQRRAILTRLAASGIAPQRVRFSGAEEIRVRRSDQLIAPERLLAAAYEALPDTGQVASASWHLTRHPEPLAVPADADATLTAHLADDSAAGRARVTVSAVAGDKTLATQELHFSARYRVRQLVAGEDLPPGTVLTPTNTEIRTVEKTSPPPADWQPPYGQKLRQRVSAGTILRAAHLAPAKLEIVVRRNEPVMMQITGEGFVISTVGRALQDGRPGEFIKVQNVDSRRVVVAKVGFDGAVEPVLKR
ncbi:MAG: flagellar basal body P-ring formation protein FlgA [Phycisphaerae bacterium]|nr:flagellar basal body P-ring formation protein FlgA [Phycisphaerae bacterium]